MAVPAAPVPSDEFQRTALQELAATKQAIRGSGLSEINHKYLGTMAVTVEKALKAGQISAKEAKDLALLIRQAISLGVQNNLHFRSRISGMDLYTDPTKESAQAIRDCLQDIIHPVTRYGGRVQTTQAPLSAEEQTNLTISAQLSTLLGPLDVDVRSRILTKIMDAVRTSQSSGKPVSIRIPVSTGLSESNDMIYLAGGTRDAGYGTRSSPVSSLADQIQAILKSNGITATVSTGDRYDTPMASNKGSIVLELKIYPATEKVVPVTTINPRADTFNYAVLNLNAQQLKDITVKLTELGATSIVYDEKTNWLYYHCEQRYQKGISNFIVAYTAERTRASRGPTTVVRNDAETNAELMQVLKAKEKTGPHGYTFNNPVNRAVINAARNGHYIQISPDGKTVLVDSPTVSFTGPQAQQKGPKPSEGNVTALDPKEAIDRLKVATHGIIVLTRPLTPKEETSLKRYGIRYSKYQGRFQLVK